MMMDIAHFFGNDFRVIGSFFYKLPFGEEQEDFHA
jgi:hypothetical protein